MNAKPTAWSALYARGSAGRARRTTRAAPLPGGGSDLSKSILSKSILSKSILSKSILSESPS
jgi:hypothetical protein